MTITAIIGTLLVAVLGTLNVSRCRRLWLLPLIFLPMVVAYLLIVSKVADDYALYPKVRSTRTVVHGAKKVAQAVEEGSQVMIINGSSSSVRGVDDEMLTKLLSEAGYRVQVIHNSIPGGNHVERLRMNYLLLQMLPEEIRERLKSSKVILLREVNASYDRHPLVGLEKNDGSDRAYAQMEPKVAWQALRFLRVAQPDDLKGAFLVIRHAVVNAFGVGRLEIPFGPPVRGLPGFVPMRRADDQFKFAGLDTAHATPPSPIEEVSTPQWLTLEEEVFTESFGGMPVSVCWFLVPNLDPNQVPYMRVRAAEKKEAGSLSPFNDTPENRELWSKLDGPEYWFDATHLSEKGSAIYTRWLADRIIEEGLLVK